MFHLDKTHALKPKYRSFPTSGSDVIHFITIKSFLLKRPQMTLHQS